MMSRPLNVQVSPRLSGDQQACGEAEDNRTLKELLQQALKREADALRKLKHLSEQLRERDSVVACSTPQGTIRGDSVARCDPSPPSTDGGQGRGEDVLRDEQEKLSQGSDTSSSMVRNMPSPDQQRNPLLTVTVENTVNIPNNPSPSPDIPHYSMRHSASDNMLSYNYVPSQWTNDDTLMRECSRPSSPSLLTPSPRSLHSSLSMLVPSPGGLRDIHTEREKPPPEMNLHSPLQHSATNPDHIMYKSKVAQSKRSLSLERLTMQRTSQRDITSPSPDLKGMRSRSSSRLKRGLNKIRGLAGPQSSACPSTLSSLDELFATYLKTSSACRQDPLEQFIDLHWSNVCMDGDCSPQMVKHHDAVWELFHEECKYLTKQLLPLEKVYKGFLEELHFHGILRLADTNKIFANLSELCELSSSVAKDLFQLFDRRTTNMVACTNELVLTFSMFGHKFNPVYQKFCSNFERQRGFIKALKQLPEFQEYLRVCRNCEMVQKIDLDSLLIAPMQHQCHYQLLLEKILKYTENPSDRSVLSSTIKAFVVSLKELESNIAEHKRSLELLELQETIFWPPISHCDYEAYIPEDLFKHLSKQPRCCMLATKDRQLMHKGPMKLLESRARPSMDLFVFLFSDMLLMTEQRTKQSKRVLTKYTVYRHPLLFPLVEVHDVPFSQVHKYLITVVEKSPMHQYIAVYSLQVQSKADKDKWMVAFEQVQQQQYTEDVEPFSIPHGSSIV